MALNGGNHICPLNMYEDLIIFKSISQRPIDIEDIKAILMRHPDIDGKRILSTVREFAGVLEMPELYQNIESLLK